MCIIKSEDEIINAYADEVRGKYAVLFVLVSTAIEDGRREGIWCHYRLRGIKKGGEIVKKGQEAPLFVSLLQASRKTA